MKKYNLLKVLGITLCAAMILTLFIPGSQADYTGNVTVGSISGVGIWAMLSNTNIALSYFSGMAFFIIAIAIFYAVLGKLESYNLFVEKTANKFSGKEAKLVTLSIVIFGILAAVVEDSMILLVFVPFIYDVMTRLEIDKKAILASTIIAILVGAMCGIYNSTLFSVFSLKLNTLLLVKVILLVISLFILTIFIAPKVKKVNNISKKEVKEEKKITSKKEVKKAEVKKETKKAPAAKKATSKSTKKAPAKKNNTKGRKKVAK